MPTQPTLPGWFHVTAKPTLNGRVSPSTKAKIRYVRPTGYNLYLRKRVSGDGRTWLVSRLGTCYAEQYLAPGRYTPPKKPTIPVPGGRWGTPWRKHNPKLWPTRGYHTGWDVEAPAGAAVIAVRPGRAVHYNDSWLGNVVLLYITINGKPYTLWHCHLSKRSGEGTVKTGQKIGEVGSTGHAFGPHLHWELRADHSAYWGGTDLDPKRALP